MNAKVNSDYIRVPWIALYLIPNFWFHIWPNVRSMIVKVLIFTVLKLGAPR